MTSFLIIFAVLLTHQKEEGMGIIIFSFCSLGFGYGFKLNSQQLAIMNNYREEGKNYIDGEEAVMEVFKQKEKLLMAKLRGIH